MKTHPYAYDFAMVFCPRWGAGIPWTAPAYLLEAVRSRGISAQYLDYNIRLYWANYTPELWDDAAQHQFWNFQPLEFLLDQIDLDEINAAVVGFSITETNIRFSIELARRLRRRNPNKTILFGGHRIFFPEEPGEQVPLDACDAIVKGEGELTLLDILHNGLDRNLGTFTPDGDHWEFNGERPLLTDLDSFPWPRYEDVNWDLYPNRVLNIMGSRGCINRCAFCNEVERVEHRYRKRSAFHIAEEMLYHKARNGIVYTDFNDPLINGHFAHFDQLCETLLQSNFDRPWGGNVAVRGNMPEDLIHKAKRAGFRRAIVGLESGSPHVLSLMRKNFTIEEAERFIHVLHEADIKVALNLVVGFPGETDDDLEQTLRFVARIAPMVSQINSVSTLHLDHSYLWDHLDEFGIVKHPQNRHISWHTEDGANTYPVRCARADRLMKLAQDLGLSHVQFDVASEQRNRTITIDYVKRQRAKLLRRQRVKKALIAAHLLGPVQRLRASREK